MYKPSFWVVNYSNVGLIESGVHYNAKASCIRGSKKELPGVIPGFIGQKSRR
ncbi:hypothetical protein N752_23565 [Desulforamulus aquiferis]|nr:hypothetical protein N752_23565 [Desulforamulus aquiferis]